MFPVGVREVGHPSFSERDRLFAFLHKRLRHRAVRMNVQGGTMGDRTGSPLLPSVGTVPGQQGNPASTLTHLRAL
jgi:hypothetical protein